MEADQTMGVAIMTKPAWILACTLLTVGCIEPPPEETTGAGASSDQAAAPEAFDPLQHPELIDILDHFDPEKTGITGGSGEDDDIRVRVDEEGLIEVCFQNEFAGALTSGSYVFLDMLPPEDGEPACTVYDRQGYERFLSKLHEIIHDLHGALENE